VPVRDYYDPRGKVNSALLVGVYRYRHAEALPGVKHNLAEMFRALMDGGVFGVEEVRTASPARRVEFLVRLEEAVDRAQGLFLLYFAGHGRLSHDGTELFLTAGDSRRLAGDEPAYTEAVSWTRDVLPKLRDIADRKRVDHIVVILDCCYAGNALEEFKPGALHLGRERISVLTSVQVNRRIPAGGGQEPTPYTKQLVRLLRHGVGDGTGLVRLSPLAAALREAMRGERTVSGDSWEPRHHRAESEPEVLLGVTVGHRDPLGRRLRTTLTLLARAVAGPAVRPLREAARRLGKAVAPLLALCLVLAAAGGYGVYRLVSATPVCAPPVQLRLLTDSDVRPTLASAVDAYLASPANHDAHGCRRSGIDVNVPKSTDAVRGFQQSALWRTPPPTGDFQPQRDIGAQPDIWIPGSSVSVQRAAAGTGKRAARLDQLGPLAYTPLVLAVPDSFSSSPADRTGAPLSGLVSRLQILNKQAVVLRADPEYTDSAQLATVGLYGTNAGEASPLVPRLLEQQAALLSPPPHDSHALMCSLAQGDASLAHNAAVLVPEQVMAQFNAPTGEHTPGCDTATLGVRYPEYPADVGMLDLPFVHVTWDGGDRDAQVRDVAVAAFHDWLTGPDGQRVFTSAGYRGLSAQPGTPALPPLDSWLTGAGAARDPKPVRYDVSADAVTKALVSYRTARGPGQVLFLLDSSSSMSQDSKVWSGPGRAKDLISQSLDGLGPSDSYGVWAVAGASPTHKVLVPLGRHQDPSAARAALAAAQTVNGEANPGASLSDALAALKGGRTNGQPQLIVYLTDGEDDVHLRDGILNSVLNAAGGDGIPVDWVSLVGGSCTPGTDKPGLGLTVRSGGRCLDASSSLASQLRDEVARVGTGDAQ
jgi:hypothetical protein